MTAAALIIGLAIAWGSVALAFTIWLLIDSWQRAAHHRRTWLTTTVRPHLRWWTHNLIAHPLLVICPPLGARLHDATIDHEGE